MTKNPYRVACDQIVGKSHASSHAPCQDFAACRRSTTMACIALADGAGSRQRSEIGAEAVVRASLRMLEAQFDEIYGMCELDKGAAQRHIHQRLMTVLQQEAATHDCEVNELASTLLFVAHKRGRFIAGHVGDGVIAQVDGDGSAQTLSHPENGEYANTTVFVTDSSAADRLRLFHGESDARVAGFALMSDGCAESLYDKQSGNPAAAVSKLIAWNATLSRNNINLVLRGNLEQSFSKKSSDDCSLALLSILA